MDESAPRRDTPKPNPLPGDLIDGRYRVIGELGGGRRGRVYLAERTSLGDRVAVRVLPYEWANDEEFATRFGQEARRLVALAEYHRNIATIHECARAADGSLFVAMEQLDGKTLADLVRDEGALEVERALRLAIEIGEGLQAVHDNAGFAHGDIRPEKIVVGEGDSVKIRGFEVARCLRSAGAHHPKDGDGCAGTATYRAPEQIAGGEPTERTDIYALGMVLYGLLTGAVPAAGKERPTPLRRRRRSVPAAVARVVMRALEENPKRRPRYMSEVVSALWAELDRFKAGPPTRRARMAWTPVAIAGVLAVMAVPLTRMVILPALWPETETAPSQGRSPDALVTELPILKVATTTGSQAGQDESSAREEPLIAERDALRRDLEQTRAELQRALETAETAQATAEATQETLTAVAAERDETLRALAATRTELAQARQAAQTAQEQLAARETERDRAQQALADSRTRVAELQRALETAETAQATAEATQETLTAVAAERDETLRASQEEAEGQEPAAIIDWLLGHSPRQKPSP